MNNIKKIIKETEEEKEKRYDELYDRAVRRYLDKTDWNIYEWLNPKEAKEFGELSNN